MATVTLIEAFRVQPEADVDFIAGWQRAGTLHRALRADVDLRYVCVAEVESADPAFPSLPFRSHTSSYHVVREHRTPDVEGGVVLIEPFELPEEGEAARFLAGWDGLRDVLEQQRGYLGARLYRSLGRADYRFVEIARWSSPLMFARALRRPDVQLAAQALPSESQPALYQAVG